jgi:ASC-1-like (ASCH) protein
MLVMIKQKYFDAIKAGTKTAEIRTKPAKVGDRVLFLCGKEKLNAVVENCEEWNSGHLTEFSGQPW